MKIYGGVLGGTMNLLNFGEDLGLLRSVNEPKITTS